MKKLKIDFFSDTNTNPTVGMRRAMAEAEVGNEVAGEDPTVNRLLEAVCTLLGKEAALFFPSGTMCNAISYRVLCQRPGDFVILDEMAHPLWKSSGMVAGLAYAQPLTVKGKRGIFTADQIKPYLTLPRGYNLSVPRVVSIEQTTNFGGGAIWPLETIQSVCELTHKQGAYTHMDGARFLNATVATGIAPDIYCRHFDLVWIDFCKTLGAPMGAVLAGSQSLVDEAWYYKFQQGGGMHQAGILAAGCLYGLEHHLQRVPEVHNLAKKLALKLQDLPFIEIDPEEVETNILIFKVKHSTAPQIQTALLKEGIRILALDEERVRLMIHLDHTLSDIETAFAAFKRAST